MTDWRADEGLVGLQDEELTPEQATVYAAARGLLVNAGLLRGDESSAVRAILPELDLLAKAGLGSVVETASKLTEAPLPEPRQREVVLKLADNRVSTIDQEAFCCVPNLQHLNLALNPLLRIKPDTFHGVHAHLQSLNVANTSLTLLPNFQLPALKSLNVSSNQLTFVPPNTLENLAEVRELDLSSNELPSPPSSAWHNMHHLRVLHLAGNPVNKVMNDSFVGLKHLEHLDISGIQAKSFQVS